MTKNQKAFFDYLQKLKAYGNPRFVETAQKEFFRYWEKYEKDGMKDSMTVAMQATEAFVGLPDRRNYRRYCLERNRTSKGDKK